MAEPLDVEQDWRERAMQLQAAFELLRAAARSNRRKLHDLSAEVVRSFATPEPVVRVVGLHPEIFQVMSREERLVQTEDFFRDVNEVIARTGGSNGSRFLCE